MLTRVMEQPENQKELQGYLEKLEKAEQVDHRKLGKENGSISFSEEAPGMVFGILKDGQSYTNCKLCKRNAEKELVTGS